MATGKFFIKFQPVIRIIDYYEDDAFLHIKGVSLINYIEIPALVKFSSGTGNTRLYGFAGGYVAFALKGKLKSTATVTYDDGQTETIFATEDLDFKEMGFNRTDIGVQAGVGVQFQKVFLEARYSHGVADLDNSDGTDAVIHNRGLVFSLGYFF